MARALRCLRDCAAGLVIDDHRRVEPSNLGLREAHQTVVARGLMGHEQDFLDSLHVMEVGMQHFYAEAMHAKANNGKPEIIDANMLQAVSIAEKIAPYRSERRSASRPTKLPTIYFRNGGRVIANSVPASSANG
jgi:hypothetical protein